MIIYVTPARLEYFWNDKSLNYSSFWSSTLVYKSLIYGYTHKHTLCNSLANSALNSRPSRTIENVVLHTSKWNDCGLDRTCTKSNARASRTINYIVVLYVKIAQ